MLSKTFRRNTMQEAKTINSFIKKAIEIKEQALNAKK
jgi:hypothetical protein